VDVPHNANMGRPTTPRTFDEKRMELTGHLSELRSRIMRSLLYILVGAIVAYQFFAPLYGFLYRPLAKEMHRQNMLKAHPLGDHILIIPHAASDPPSKQDYDKLADAVEWIYNHPAAIPAMSIIFHNFHEPFMLQLKISIIYGFILVLPLVVWEFASFITPALTPEERKPLRLLVPVSILLLIFGVTVAYFTMFYAMRWFLTYLDNYPQPAVLMQDPNDYILFFVKMMAAFGIAFQLPVVLMFGAFVGIITSRGLIKHWRWGVVLAVLGGVFTPSNDLFSMALMTFPLLLLYGLSIFLVKLIERMKAQPKPAHP
jgi:sec-independent protein translocase protein TatC